MPMIQRIKKTVAVALAIALALIALTPVAVGIYYIFIGTFHLATVDEDKWMSQFEIPVYYAEVSHGFICLIAGLVCIPVLGVFACAFLDYADQE